MKQRLPGWKRMISYAVPWPVAQWNTETNGPLSLKLVGGRLQLTSRNAIYAFEDRYTSFARAMYVIKERLPRVQSLLILGFGFGSINMILHRQYGLHPLTTGVDHDEVLIKAFSQYYAADHITLHHADAKQFLRHEERQYDMICIDLFKDALVPKKFESDQFLQAVADHLAPQGMVLYNRLTMETGLANATENFYHHHFTRFFPEAFYVDTAGNWILIGENTK